MTHPRVESWEIVDRLAPRGVVRGPPVGGHGVLGHVALDEHELGRVLDLLDHVEPRHTFLLAGVRGVHARRLEEGVLRTQDHVHVDERHERLGCHRVLLLAWLLRPMVRGEKTRQTTPHSWCFARNARSSTALTGVGTPYRSPFTTTPSLRNRSARGPSATTRSSVPGCASAIRAAYDAPTAPSPMTLMIVTSTPLVRAHASPRWPSLVLGPVRGVLPARLYARRLAGHLGVLGRVRHLALAVLLVAGVPVQGCTDGRGRRLLEHLPDVAALLEAAGHRPHGEIVRVGVGEFLPRQRRGDAGLGRGPDRAAA